MSDVAVTVLVSLFTGAAGGVIFAGTIAQRTEAAKEHFAAAAALHEIVAKYRDTLAYDGQGSVGTGGLGAAWQNAEQEKFAESVLRQIPHLGRSRRARIRALLECLVGRATVNVVGGRINVPHYMITQERETERLARAVSDAARTGDMAVLSGQLTPSLTQPDPGMRQARYKQAAATLDAMIKVVRR